MGCLVLTEVDHDGRIFVRSDGCFCGFCNLHKSKSPHKNCGGFLRSGRDFLFVLNKYQIILYH